MTGSLSTHIAPEVQRLLDSIKDVDRDLVQYVLNQKPVSNQEVVAAAEEFLKELGDEVRGLHRAVERAGRPKSMMPEVRVVESESSSSRRWSP